MSGKMPDPPKMESSGDTYLLTWPQEGIKMKLNRIHEKADLVTAEMIVTKEEGHLYQARVNLLSVTSKNSLAKEMERRLDGVSWPAIIEQAFMKTLTKYREGEPVLVVGNMPQRDKARYRLKPFVLENEMNAIYAYGGAGKSVVSDLIAVSVQCGVAVCGFQPVQGNVILCDWETSHEVVNERIRAIKKGMKITAPELPLYRRFYHPLSDDVYLLQEIVAKENIKLVIVDSANMASGVSGDFHSPALSMLGALRSLNTSILIIDHKPKDGTGMFGTIIKTNTCRSIFEFRANQEEDSSIIDIGIFHAKHNDTPKFKPIGLQVEFFGTDELVDQIVFKRLDVSDLPKINESLTYETRILAFLKSGESSIASLASELGTTENSIRVSLSRLKKKNKVISLERGMWGLSAL